jgi:PPOX class probable F420-dependent enzyme
MDESEMRQRVQAARVARLATASADGRPHIVPVCFALDGDTLFFAVDGKPKRTTDLKRLRNISANPAVSMVVDHYEDDWTQLWWVRLDGTARIVPPGDDSERALDLLSARYPQYRRAPPDGPVVAIAIERVTGWTAS